MLEGESQVPLYEYRCKQCGHQFEKIQTFSAADQTECPECKGELERLISAPSVRFSGSGFYSTDYGSRASRSGSKSSEGGNSDSGSSGDSSKGGDSGKSGEGSKSGESSSGGSKSGESGSSGSSSSSSSDYGSSAGPATPKPSSTPKKD
jgi:putative FmdB family regulatory protein